MPHVVQAKVEVVETIELALRRCVTVGLQREDTRSSILIAVLDDCGYAIGHYWIVETVGEDHYVRARLEDEWVMVRYVGERERRYEL